MINVTVLQLLQIGPALQSLATQPHKGRVAFRIRKLIMAVQPKLAAASAARDTLFTEENSIPAGNGARQLKPECVTEVLNDPLFRDMVSLDADLLSMADLEDALISVEHIDALAPLMEP
ncbi:MAG TPA: hypothetical protein VGM97_10080 [Steroidobacteraceae bacterium]